MSLYPVIKTSVFIMELSIILKYHTLAVSLNPSKNMRMYACMLQLLKTSIRNSYGFYLAFDTNMFPVSPQYVGYIASHRIRLTQLVPYASHGLSKVEYKITAWIPQCVVKVKSLKENEVFTCAAGCLLDQHCRVVHEHMSEGICIAPAYTVWPIRFFFVSIMVRAYTIPTASSSRSLSILGSQNFLYWWKRVLWTPGIRGPP